MYQQAVKIFETLSDFSLFYFKLLDKEMETRLPMPALQEIFATCWFCIKVIFIYLVDPLYEEAYSEPSQTSRMQLSACIDNGVSPWIILMGECI